MKHFLICLIIFTLIGAAQAQDDPTRAVALNDQGVAEYEAKNYETAIKLFEQAIGLDSKYATAYYNLGSAYSRLKDYERSLGALEKAVELYPRYAEAYNQIGFVHAEKGNFDKL
jgi:tetratricopeptide (TPR) repeat protein